MRRVSYNFIYKKFIILFILFFNLQIFCESNFAYLDEYIDSFHSDITVHKNAVMDVQETIIYVNNGKRARGIYRDFPTTYYMNKIFKQVRGFDVVSVERDGKPEKYHIDWVSGGYRVFFGNKDIYLSPGKYTYKIKYKTNKQLGFFDKFDELYWNVNGTGWLMPIKNVSAKVFLPAGIAAKDMGLTGYTGVEGAKGKDFEAKFDADGMPIFNSTRSFEERENLTIAVNWPKGFVAAPSMLAKIIYFIKDNIFFIISVILFFIILVTAIILYIRKRRTQVFGTVIPLFYPPKDLTPADVRYIYRMGYDEKVFAAEIINMAVNGLITIKYDASMFFGRGTYTLVKKQENFDKQGLPKHWYLLDLLFRSTTFFGFGSSPTDSIKLDQNNSQIIQKAVEQLKNFLKNSFKEKYFLKNKAYIIAGIAALIMMLGIFTGGVSLIVLGFVTFGIFGLFYYLLSGYTQDGLKIKTEIDGFRMFLATTEEDRLKVIGTPPTKTPQLYEKYLPYAVALGVEKQWSDKFAPVFAQMKAAGNPYIPLWYIGAGGFDRFDTNSFASDLSKAATDLSKNLSRSSGSNGGGSSGGGGGGGGGGSW